VIAALQDQLAQVAQAVPPALSHLWQSSVFAAVIALATLALRHNHARARHWLWMAASLKFLVPFSLFVALGSQIHWRTAAPALPPQLTFVMEESPAPSVAQPIARPAPPPPATRAPDFLPALWFCGFAAVLLRWSIRWRRVARTVRHATPVPSAPRRLGGERSIPVLSSPCTLEPGVFGIFRPVLLLPAGIAEHLSDAQFESILAHEFCHVRHRDNLAAAIHMLVETLYWFHPLVWWIGARLVEERERACDEEVLQLGSDPEVYAESILKVCRFCLESPLPCVSGIAGADLQRRIETIMTPRLARHLNLGKKLLLAALGVAAVAGPIAIGLLDAPRSRAQSQPRTAAPLAFDVASVKVLDTPAVEKYLHRSGGRITWRTDLFNLVQYAYNIDIWRISEVPGSPVYLLDATMDPSTTEDQLCLMFQTLLRERFKMVAHRVTKDIDGYALTIGKGGFKIKEATPEDKPAPWPEWMQGRAPAEEGWVSATLPESDTIAITGRRASILKLSETLQRILHIMVADETGLPGTYYFAFRCARDEYGDVDVSSLAGALQQNLGLKLERWKGPVDMLVIDHIETTPTGN